MESLFRAQLRHQLIRFSTQFVKNPGTLPQNIRILRVFRAELFGRGIIEKATALTEVRHDELVTQSLIVRHCAQTGARSHIHFFQPRNRCDIE